MLICAFFDSRRARLYFGREGAGSCQLQGRIAKNVVRAPSGACDLPESPSRTSLDNSPPTQGHPGSPKCPRRLRLLALGA